MNTNCPPVWPSVWLGDDGIMRIDHGRENPITLESVRYVHQQRMALLPEKHPYMVLTKGSVKLTPEAKTFVSSREVCTITSAGATVTTSLITRHFAQIFLRYYPLPHPLRIFATEAEAVAWLKDFVRPSAGHCMDSNPLQG